MTEQAPRPPGLDELDDESWQRLYGRWDGLTPAAVAALLDGAPFRWWIAGGWAASAVAGRVRRHADTDVAVLARDLEEVRAWLAAFHLWEPHEGTLRPLLPGDSLGPGREQLWVRRDADSPWILDLALTPTEGEDWLFKRDHSLRWPLNEIGQTVDGVSYLRPCLVFLYKARQQRPKDETDFVSALPHLPDDDREWLARALDKTHPGHPWRDLLLSAA